MQLQTVVIEEGVITSIDSDVDDAHELEEQVEELTNALTEAQEIINEYKNNTQSGYTVRNRSRNPKRNKGGSSSADKKNEANEKRKKWKGGK